MTDIVDRLRRFKTGCDKPECERMIFTPLVCEEAAAEIERLRAALELFACDCIESGNLCPSPQNCRNYIARTALEGRDA